MTFTYADDSALPTLATMVTACIHTLRAAGIDMWDEAYPTPEAFRQDHVNKNLMLLKDDDARILGAVTLDADQPPEYLPIHWHFTAAPIGVVHRLMVDPSQRGKGLAKMIMLHLEAEAIRKGFRTLRLDAFSKNPAALKLYATLGYRNAGNVTFRQKGTFFCFEKQIQPVEPPHA